jgi:hypothetical protein
MAVKKGGDSGTMNTIMMVVGIIVLAVVGYYIWYTWFSGVNTLSSKQINLNAVVAPPPVLASSLSNPKSTRYSYGIWTYINTWNVSKNKVIFSRLNDIVVYLDDTSAVLKCIIGPKYTDGTKVIGNVVDLTKIDTTQAIVITSNFPIQKWVFLTFVIDNQTIDIYLDGKMVKSLAIQQVSPDDQNNIYYGYASGFDTVISGFQRWATPIDPQTVWSTYTSGNGSSTMGAAGGYHAEINVTKNSSPSTKIKIF